MAVPVLVIGKSGSGKSTAMRNCVDNPHWNLISVLGKPLPFRGKIPQVVSDDYRTIMACLSKSEAESIVIDDAGYLITNMFMKEHSSTGGGNAVFVFYNKIADHFWNLIEFIRRLPENKIIYVLMHEEQSDFGDIKPKTLGKLLDEKVCLEGMFTIVLRSIEENGKYYFVTQMKDGAVSKSPLGMFEDVKIDNDLKAVDDTIRKYYEIEVAE